MQDLYFNQTFTVFILCCINSFTEEVLRHFPLRETVKTKQDSLPVAPKSLNPALAGGEGGLRRAAVSTSTSGHFKMWQY